MTKTRGEQGPESSIEAAVAAAEQDGLRFHLRVRIAVLAALAVWLVAHYAPARAIPGLFAIVAFAGLGIASYTLGRRYGCPVVWAGVFSILEVVLLLVVVLAPITFPEGWPPQVQLRLVTVIYLFIYVAGTVLSYSPSLVIWTGALTVAGWGVGHLIMTRLPGTITVHGALLDKPGLSPTGSLALFLHPLYVSDAAWRTQTVLLILLTAVLAAAVARSRRLLRRQVADHLARANLARYFSPNVVEMLAIPGPSGMAARRQRVAVLFADIKGFTTLSESIGVEDTMEFLQGFHELTTRVVFAYRGTLEKYIGDAVMATFGTPSPGADDARRALRCACDLVDETSRWSESRAARGEPPVEIGVGLHYGEAVAGSIGAGQRLDYVVIGDTVNVASRLERLTRELDVRIVMSDELVARIHDEDSAADVRLDGFVDRGEVHVAGRLRPITVWTADHRRAGRVNS